MADAPRDQREMTEAVLRMKTESETVHHPATDDHADEGMRSIPFEDQAPSGAFDAEGHRPVLERSRKVR